ncbi:MAG: hypothetical protein CMP24_05185 [Rickettsiales bacterium]|nr:hypothetical protein [Rickettsiales bacterium]
MNEIDIKQTNGTVVITLQRERVLNALNLNMVREIYKKIYDWEADESVSGVLIKGSGEKAFCAGGDIVQVYHARNELNNNISDTFFREEYLLNYAISKFKKPWVSILNGIAMGGGLGLSVHGSHRIVTERTITAMPETAIGLFPDVGGGYFLSRMKNSLGKYIAITGNTLDYQDTIYCGIGTNIIKNSDLDKFIESLLDQRKYDEITINSLIKEFEKSTSFKSNLNNEENLINKYFSQESMIQVYQALKEDDSDWAKKTLAIINKKSPTSMTIAFEQIKRSAELSLKDCLAMEFRICQAMMSKHDFYEGVRANLVDKDRKPVWSPLHIKEISEEIISEHFKHLGNKELF